MGRLSDFRTRAARAVAFNNDSGARGWAGATDRLNAERGASMRATLSSRGDGPALLPANAKAKLEALRERRDELHAVINDLAEKVEQARLTKFEHERHLRSLQSRDILPQALPDDDPAVVRQREKIEAADAELRRLEDRRDARSAEWQGLGQPVDAAERWLASLPPDAVLEPAEVEVPKLNKSETPTTGVDRLRRKRRDLLADMQAVDAAPITSTTAKAKVRAEIEALADRGRPDLFGTIEHGDAIRWPESSISAPLLGFVAADGAPQLQGHAHAKVADSLALVAWLYKGDLLAALDAEVDSISDDAAALTDEERAARRADIAASVLDCERAECSLVESIGGAVAYRPDTDPRALLAVIGPAPQEN